MRKKLIDWDDLNEQFPLVVGKKRETKKLKQGVRYLAIITGVAVELSSKNQQLKIVYDLHVNTESGEPVIVKKFTQLIPEHEHFLAAELEFFGIEIDHMSELSAKLQKLVGLEVVITISYPKNYGFPSPGFVSLVDISS
jgi:hypothetical protein